MQSAFGSEGRCFVPANSVARIFKEMADDSPSLPLAPKKAAVNAPHSKRFAQFEGVRQSRSVWTARVFSTAFRRG
jgi:hypothetical protein